LVAALGGTSAAAAILMDWNKTFKEKQQARSNDFFFLWEAANR
jgi:glucokinase